MRLVSDNLEHLRPWLAWAQERPSLDGERAYLAGLRVAWEGRTDFAYLVTLPNLEPIGGIGMHRRHGPATMEIGYWIAAAHTSRGYATSAARAVTDAAFSLPCVERVEIHCDEANRASAAIPRRLGFALVEVINRRAAAPAETGRRTIWAVERQSWLPGC